MIVIVKGIVVEETHELPQSFCWRLWHIYGVEFCGTTGWVRVYQGRQVWSLRWIWTKTTVPSLTQSLNSWSADLSVGHEIFKEEQCGDSQISASRSPLRIGTEVSPRKRMYGFLPLNVYSSLVLPWPIYLRHYLSMTYWLEGSASGQRHAWQSLDVPRRASP